MTGSPRSRMTMRLLTLLAVACTMVAVASAQYGYINVYSPEKGSQYEAPSYVSVYWELEYVKDAYYNNSYLNLDYSPDGGKSWYNIASGLDIFTTNWEWEVTADMPAGDEYYFRITEGCNGKRCTPIHYEGISAPFSIIRSCAPPTIFQNPQDLTACSGTNITFTVLSDAKSATYTWTKDGVPVSQSPYNTFTINNCSTTDEGSYQVNIMEDCGEQVTSSAATLTVVASPKITQNPVAAVEVCEQASTTLYAAATGFGIKYQWRFNGVNIPNATGTSLFLDPLTVASTGSYDVVVTGVCTPAVTSTPTKITVVAKPVITQDLMGAVLCSGASGQLSIGATGSSLTYKWYRNGVLLPGFTGPTLPINAATQANAGIYSVTVVSGGSNPLGCPSISYSRDAQVSVLQAPKILNQPSVVEACMGNRAEVVVVAEGFALNYQWLKNGSPIANSNTHALVLDDVSASTTGTYSVVVTGSCGMTVSSLPILVRAMAEPTFTQQPAAVTLQAGERLTLTAAATNSASIQWYRNSVAIPGAKSYTYSVESAAIADAGIYTAIVTNSCGAMVSSQARVLVRDASSQNPELTLAPDAVDFGDIPVGYSKVLTLTNLLTNTGTAPLIVESIVPSSADFTITSGPTTPFTLQPNESATLSLRALTGTLGVQNGTLTVTSNGVIPVEQVSLVATGVQHLSHLPTLSYALVPVNTPKELCVSVTNGSDATVTIDQLSLFGTDAAMFSVISTTPLDVPAGASRDLCVRFTPTTSGDLTAQLSILSATAGNSSVALMGTGDSPSDVAIDATRFMSIQPNPTSGAVTLRLTEFPATRVDIVSITGMAVRTLNVTQSATNTITWDGLDASGSPAASGAYLMLVHGANGVISMPLSIIR